MPQITPLKRNVFSTSKNVVFANTPILIGGDFNMVECSQEITSNTHTQGLIQLQYLKDKWRNENDRKQNDNTQYTDFIYFTGLNISNFYITYGQIIRL